MNPDAEAVPLLPTDRFSDTHPYYKYLDKYNTDLKQAKVDRAKVRDTLKLLWEAFEETLRKAAAGDPYNESDLFGRLRTALRN